MNKRLHCFYDLAVSPCSFDFFQFLIIAEINRIRDNFNEIELTFISGPNHGFREDNLRTYEQNEQYFQNVIWPGCQLLPSIKSVKLETDRKRVEILHLDPSTIFPRGYSIIHPINDYICNGITTSHFLGEDTINFKAPDYAIKSASKFINNTKNKKILILSTRELERDDNLGVRSIEHNVWKDFLTSLDSDEWIKIVIRDTNSSFSSEKLFDEIVEADFASYHLHLRFALYELSNINIFKSNGPAILSLYGNLTPTVMFLEFDNTVTAMSQNWFRGTLGMVKGSQFPLTRKNNLIIWEKENKENLIKAINIIEGNSSIKYKYDNDYFNIENLLYTTEVAINYTLKNMLYDIRKVDLKIFRKYDTLVERKIMHPMYKKFVTKSKKFSAHDSKNKFNVGDVVSIRECNPISKNKRFEVIY